MNQRYLLIREWGCGFYADFLQVAQGVYLARLLGRTPVVYWGKTSLYNNIDDSNIYPYFFSTGPDLLVNIPEVESVFPSGYTAEPHVYLDKARHTVDKRVLTDFISALAESDADMCVYDRFINLNPILKEIGFDADKIQEDFYAKLVSELHTPSDLVKENIDRNLKLMGLPEEFHAVHLRLSEKVRTKENFDTTIRQYLEFVRQKIDDDQAALFVCSDSDEAVDFFRNNYEGEIFTSQASRKVFEFDKDASKLGIVDNQFVPEFLLTTPGIIKKHLGVDVVTDVAISSKAKTFIGSYSNVSKITTLLLPPSSTFWSMEVSEVVSADLMR